MKAVLLVAGIFYLLSHTCHPGQAAGTTSTAVQTKQAITDTAVDFAKDIQPIFVQRCSPCHFPGGKMYGRMPFDKDTTIINHAKGILKRIKDEKENALLKQFIRQMSDE